MSAYPPRAPRAPHAPHAPRAPGDAHEWVSFEDPDEDRTWVVDVTFLASAWRCIYGDGCKGVLTAAAPEQEEGCCSYGAHFTDDDDIARVEAAAATLTPAQWQFRSRGLRPSGIVRRNRRGEATTRLVEGACIFLNRVGFEGGAGCALHRAALDRSVAPLELKPDVCWQLPLRREDSVGANGHVTSTLSEWKRRDWGAGGAEFHWWCTEAPEAFTAHEPVYVAMRNEITAMTSEALYVLIEAYLGDRAKARVTVPLPHPAVRS